MKNIFYAKPHLFFFGLETKRDMKELYFIKKKTDTKIYIYNPIERTIKNVSEIYARLNLVT